MHRQQRAVQHVRVGDEQAPAHQQSPPLIVGGVPVIHPHTVRQRTPPTPLQPSPVRQCPNRPVLVLRIERLVLVSHTQCILLYVIYC
jgi:hypothetical protein